MTLDPMLSRFIGGLGLLLPLALYLAAGRQESLSAYYHTPAQPLYLLILLSVAGLLAAFGVVERGMPVPTRAVALAAALALAGTALVPTSGPLETVHGTMAAVFFGLAAWLTWHWGVELEYKALAWVIVGSMLAALLAPRLGKPIYWPEVVAVSAFSLGWLRRVL